MTRALWDQVGERRYENGVDQGMLYIPTNGVYSMGYAWNGLTTVTESPTGAESNKQYADNQVYLNLMSAEEFSATIEAFTYPRSFAVCNGTAVMSGGIFVGQQTRKSFGFSYRTKIGTDLDPDAGYKIHLVYGALAAPSEVSNTTVNESPEAVGMSWECTTTPVQVTTVDPSTGKVLKPTATLTIDSTMYTQVQMAALEDLIYGTVANDPRLPLPDEVFALFAGAVTQTAAITAPTATTAGLITVPAITGVTWRRTDTNAVVVGTVQIPGAVGSSLVVKANANAGYKLPQNTDDDWSFTKTV